MKQKEEMRLRVYLKEVEAEKNLDALAADELDKLPFQLRKNKPAKAKAKTYLSAHAVKRKREELSDSDDSQNEVTNVGNMAIKKFAGHKRKSLGEFAQDHEVDDEQTCVLKMKYR